MYHLYVGFALYEFLIFEIYEKKDCRYVVSASRKTIPKGEKEEKHERRDSFC